MAMRSEVIRTPEWLRVEIGHDPNTLEYVMNIGVKCYDGWAHLVSLDVADAYYEGNKSFSKLSVCREHHEFVTKKLAILALEEK